MACGTCNTMKGHFGVSDYVQASPQQLFTNTGPVVGTPNGGGGMHAKYQQVSGLGDIFGVGQTNWIQGIPNEYIAGGAALILVLVMMK